MSAGAAGAGGTGAEARMAGGVAAAAAAGGRYRSPFWPQAESAKALNAARALTRIDRDTSDIEEL